MFEQIVDIATPIRPAPMVSGSRIFKVLQSGCKGFGFRDVEGGLCPAVSRSSFKKGCFGP